MTGRKIKPEDKEFTRKQISLLAARIKQLRIASGYTSAETFAYEKDIARAQYGRYEQGTDIRFASLVRLAKAFDMTLTEFLGEGFGE